jgi:hypothetical protein
MKARFLKKVGLVATTLLFATPLASASTIVLNFDDLSAMGFGAGTPIPVSAQLSTLYRNTFGVSFTSGSPYVAVVNLGFGHATSGTPGRKTAADGGNTSIRALSCTVCSAAPPGTRTSSTPSARTSRPPTWRAMRERSPTTSRRLRSADCSRRRPRDLADRRPAEACDEPPPPVCRRRSATPSDTAEITRPCVSISSLGLPLVRVERLHAVAEDSTHVI